MTKNLLDGEISAASWSNWLSLLRGELSYSSCIIAVHSIIIGRFVGSTAFAAVGVAGTVRNLFVFMISGVCVGVSILFAQLYGCAGVWTVTGGRFFLALSLGGGFHTGADYP